MIVCSCNKLTEQAVRACGVAASSGPLRVIDIYGELGCQPQCGRCAPALAAIVKDQREIGCACTPDSCPCAGGASGAQAA